MGFDVGWCCFRAADVGAVHARGRVAIIAHTNGERLHGVFERERGTEKERPGKEKWSKNREFTALYTTPDGVLQEGDGKQIKPLLVRGDDGFPDAVDRIKCLGNAVVPQQFYPVFRAIAEIEGS